MYPSLIRRLSIIALAAPTFLSLTAVAQKPFSVQHRWTIGGKGGWDYLLADSSAHRLWVTHGDRVEAIDTVSGKVVGTISGFKRTHGIALEPSGKVGYISDGGANVVTLFDRASLAKLGSIPVGANPDGIIFEPKTRSVLALNGGSNNASLIDAANQKVIATIPMPGKPEFPAVDGSGVVFVNIEDKNEIVRVDLKARAITATWPLAGCDSPTGLAIDVPGHRLFSVCENKMVVTDSRSGKSLGVATIGPGADAAAYDPKDKLAFSSNGLDGTLTVVDAGKPGYAVLQNVKTQKSGRTMAFDSDTGKAFVVVAEFGPPPAATAAEPHPHAILPGTFAILVVGRY